MLRLLLSASPILLLVLAIGCGNNNSATGESADSDEFALGGLLDGIDLTETGPASSETEKDTQIDTGELLISGEDSEEPDTLKLQLVRGSRFPLVKTVEQTLVHKSPEYPASASTKLELFMELAVQDVRSDAVLMNVVYQRVSYLHDVGGQILSYDSAVPNQVVPTGLAPYAGMVNHGFSFWIGTDNRIRQVVGYEEFLTQCVRDVPVDQQQQITAGLRENGVAGFIDDSIGLLPFSAEPETEMADIAVGDEWIRTRRMAGTSPVEIQTTCRLISLDESKAEISLTEQLIPDTNMQATSNVTIIDGRSSGSCIVDRGTGIPIESTRTRFMNLRVDLGNGQTIDQEKQVRTTIATGSEPRGPIVKSAPGNGLSPQSFNNIQPVSGAGNGQGAVTIPTAPQRQLSSTTTAIYPE